MDHPVLQQNNLSKIDGIDRSTPLMEENPHWKTSFDGRQQLKEDSPRWKTNLDESQT